MTSINSKSFSVPQIFSRLLASSAIIGAMNQVQAIDSPTSRLDRRLLSNSLDEPSSMIACSDSDHLSQPCNSTLNNADNWSSLVGSTSCSADVLTFPPEVAGGDPAHLIVKGRYTKCAIAHKVAADAYNLPGCENAQLNTESLPQTHERFYHPYGYDNHYSEAIYDKPASGCAGSVNAKIRALSVHKDALITGIILGGLLFSRYKTKQFSNDLRQFKGNGNNNNPIELKGMQLAVLGAIAFEQMSLLTSQAALGAVVLDAAAKVGGNPNPYAGYDAKESFVQGLVGSAIVTGVLMTPRLMDAIDMTMRGQTQELNEQYLSAISSLYKKITIINQFAGAALGAAIMSAFKENTQHVSEALQASTVGTFFSLAVGPILDACLIELGNLILKSTQNNPNPAAQEAQQPHAAQPQEPHLVEMAVLEQQQMPQHNRIDALQPQINQILVEDNGALNSAQVLADTIDQLIKAQDLLAEEQHEIVSFEDLIEADDSRKFRFLCPISFQIKRNPVVLASMNYPYPYDKTSIEAAINTSQKHPVTGEKITPAELKARLIPDAELQTEILTWLESFAHGAKSSAHENNSLSHENNSLSHENNSQN